MEQADLVRAFVRILAVAEVAHNFGHELHHDHSTAHTDYKEDRFVLEAADIDRKGMDFVVEAFDHSIDHIAEGRTVVDTEVVAVGKDVAAVAVAAEEFQVVETDR